MTNSVEDTKNETGEELKAQVDVIDGVLSEWLLSIDEVEPADKEMETIKQIQTETINKVLDLMDNVINNRRSLLDMEFPQYAFQFIEDAENNEEGQEPMTDEEKEQTITFIEFVQDAMIQYIHEGLETEKKLYEEI